MQPDFAPKFCLTPKSDSGCPVEGAYFLVASPQIHDDLRTSGSWKEIQPLELPPNQIPRCLLKAVQGR